MQQRSKNTHTCSTKCLFPYPGASCWLQSWQIIFLRLCKHRLVQQCPLFTHFVKVSIARDGTAECQIDLFQRGLQCCLTGYPENPAIRVLLHSCELGRYLHQHCAGQAGCQLLAWLTARSLRFFPTSCSSNVPEENFRKKQVRDSTGKRHSL